MSKCKGRDTNLDADGFIKKKNLDADGEHSTASTVLMTPMRDIWGGDREQKTGRAAQNFCLVETEILCLSFVHVITCNGSALAFSCIFAI